MLTTRYQPSGEARRNPAPSRRRGPRVAAVFAVAGLAVAACGGDDDDHAGTSATPTQAAPADPVATSAADTTVAGSEPTAAPGATSAPAPSSAPGATDPAASGADPEAEAELQTLYEQAQEEGTVTVYGPILTDRMELIAERFNSEHPGVDVEIVNLNVDEIVSRLNTEQRGGQYAADVVINDGFRLQQLLSIDAIEPYEPVVMPELLEGLEAIDGFSSVAFVTTRAVAYNPTRLDELGIEAPTSLEDLTQPEWRENFATTPHGVDIFTGMIAAYGEERATELLDALGANVPRLVESNSQSITQVQTGDIAAAITYGTYASPAKQSDPTTLDFFNTDPLLTTTYFQALAAQAPHPSAARLFLNWFGSQSGQQAMVDESGFTSIRADVDNDPDIWNPDVWTPAFVAPLGLEEYNEQLARYRTAMNVP